MNASPQDGPPSATRPLLVIVPAYNEERQIGPLVENIRHVAPQADVLVIDDASSDRTAQRAREAGARVVRHPVNLGYGATIQTGYKHALRAGYEIVAQMDGDGQHDPVSLPALLEPVAQGRCDVAVGSRFLGVGDYEAPWSRRLGMRLFAAIASAFTRRRVTDPTSGYQAMNRSVLALYAQDIFPHDYPDADTLILLHFAGYRAEEVPVLMHRNATGKSIHAGWLRPLYYIFKMLLAILVLCLNRREIRRWTHA